LVAAALREAGLAANVTAASDVPSVAARTLRQSELLREAATGSRNFGLGSATRAEADAAGRAWVGDGARIASDGSALVSLDGLRQYRLPSLKPRIGKTQANFERREVPKGPWQSNGHLDIVD
jgi:filamentous hemagglutinin